MAAETTPPPFAPPGMATNDNWFAKRGDTYHAFYLQVPLPAAQEADARHDWGVRAAWAHVGHATSRDLVHWTDHGPALVALQGTWNDGSIATGSVIERAGKWWMAYTGIGRVHGVGLAVSDDLMSWKKVGDGPVVPLGKPIAATWQGQPLKWAGCADPYLYPEPIDGWYWMILNSQTIGAPTPTSGCLTVMRSRDLLKWEPGPVLCFPGWVERLETPQLWRHGDRWYLSAGVAHDHPAIPESWVKVAPAGSQQSRRTNIVLTASRPEGPYEVSGQWVIHLPDGKFGYIHKVLPGPDGREVLLTTMDGGISHPYQVSYAADGSLVLK